VAPSASNDAETDEVNNDDDAATDDDDDAADADTERGEEDEEEEKEELIACEGNSEEDSESFAEAVARWHSEDKASDEAHERSLRSRVTTVETAAATQSGCPERSESDRCNANAGGESCNESKRKRDHSKDTPDFDTPRRVDRAGPAAGTAGQGVTKSCPVTLRSFEDLTLKLSKEAVTDDLTHFRHVSSAGSTAALTSSLGQLGGGSDELALACGTLTRRTSGCEAPLDKRQHGEEEEEGEEGEEESGGRPLSPGLSEMVDAGLESMKAWFRDLVPDSDSDNDEDGPK
jgi:hypothetical protein